MGTTSGISERVDSLSGTVKILDFADTACSHPKLSFPISDSSLRERVTVLRLAQFNICLTKSVLLQIPSDVQLSMSRTLLTLWLENMKTATGLLRCFLQAALINFW